MKKIFMALLAIAAIMLAGCKSEKIDFGGEDNTPGIEGEEGYLSLDGFNLSVANYAEEITTNPNTRAAGATTDASDDYKIKIKSVKTGEEKVYTYGELKLLENRKLSLAPGSYVISAESPDYADYAQGGKVADWNTPVYAGSVTKNVIKHTETTVNDLVCTLANIKTTVSLSKDLQGLFMPDNVADAAGKEKLSVTLGIGDNQLLFDRKKAEDGSAGYFKAVEATNTVKIVLAGQYNKAPGNESPVYVPISWTKEITNCKAGQWRKVSIGVLNAGQGNVQFQITVENWVYDQKIDVDVMKLYASGEEVIEDEDISDENSPIVTLEGGNIATGYTINGAKYDEELGKWSENLKNVFTPQGGTKIKSIDMVFSSDNAAFLASIDGAGYKNRTVSMWPENNALTSYLVLKEGTSAAISSTLKDAGMSAFFKYQGTHTVKFVVKDTKGRTSYTKMPIKVTESGVIESGPVVTWTSKDGSKTYDFNTRYKHSTVEILIGITTQTAFSSFTVDIISDKVLPPSELIGVGLTDHLDLINPGQYEESLKNFGFPTGSKITGSKSISFDISDFMGLLTLLNKEGNCDFRLNVTDASGTTTKTIQLYVSK